jgi:hypothetical protein
VNLAKHQRGWQREGVAFNPSIGLDFVRDGILIVLLVLPLAWLLPRWGDVPRTFTGRLEWMLGRLEQPWNEVQVRWNRAFSNLNYPDSSDGPSDRIELQPFTATLELAHEPVLEVGAASGHYWRGQVYDEYTGLGWRNTDDTWFELTAGDASLLGVAEESRGRVHITQTFTLLEMGADMLYAAGEPFLVDRAVTARANRSPEIAEGDDSPPMLVSLLSGQEDEFGSYTVVSSVSRASAQELGAAPGEYPAWVRARYLALPSALPQRVRELALRLTRDQPNPYAKATALEAYLRQIPYNRLAEPPPPGRELVDHFLYENREGHCYHHASAMVVLARAAGIPARLASGFGQGSYDAARDVYVVKDSDAHAWAEIYFPSYGWVEFEATPSQPLIARPQSESIEESSPAPESIPSPLPPIETRRSFSLRDPSYIIGFLLLALLLGSVSVGVGRGFLWLMRVEGDTLVEQTYERMTRYMRILGVRRPFHHTPLEYARNIARSFPQGGWSALRIAQLYVRERYSGRSSSRREAREAQRELGKLRTRLWQNLARHILARLGRIYRRILE